tara:strand:+ start:2031 stop:2273 length:243 start_codon:yes stop_codon:yes gene_type:complete
VGINPDLLDLSDAEKTALSKVRLDKPTQSLLQAILDGTKRPKYRQKRSVFNQLGDMINQSGYREGVEDVVELLSLSGKGK